MPAIDPKMTLADLVVAGPEQPSPGRLGLDIADLADLAPIERVTAVVSPR